MHPQPAIDDLFLAPENLSPLWREVHNDLLAQGFHIAAFHMVQMVRYMKPTDYWFRKGAKR